MSKVNLRSSQLIGSKLLNDSEDDPMGSMGNLMDVMLVFACGLILAVIAHWNVDLANVQGTSTGTTDSPNVKSIDGDIEAVEEGIAADDGTYKNMGSVYMNEETGQLYMVTPN